MKREPRFRPGQGLGRSRTAAGIVGHFFRYRGDVRYVRELQGASGRVSGQAQVRRWCQRGCRRHREEDRRRGYVRQAFHLPESLESAALRFRSGCLGGKRTRSRPVPPKCRRCLELPTACLGEGRAGGRRRRIPGRIRCRRPRFGLDLPRIAGAFQPGGGGGKPSAKTSDQSRSAVPCWNGSGEAECRSEVAHLVWMAKARSPCRPHRSTHASGSRTNGIRGESDRRLATRCVVRQNGSVAVAGPARTCYHGCFHFQGRQIMTRFPHGFVLTVMSDDHPGIVAAVSDAVESLGGNIDSCSQTVLGGYFTLIMIVSVPEPIDPERLAQRIRGASLAGPATRCSCGRCGLRRLPRRSRPSGS